MVKSLMRSKLDVLQPAVDHHTLLTPSTIVFNWEMDVTFISVAVYKMDHFWYCVWYHCTFSGTKRCHIHNGHNEVELKRPSNRMVIASFIDEDTGPVTSMLTGGSTSSLRVDSYLGASSSSSEVSTTTSSSGKLSSSSESSSSAV